MKISDINVLDGFIKELQLAEAKQKNRLVLEHRLSNGKIRYVDVQSGLVAYKGENIICSIIHDITAQRNSEIVLRDRNADISEMLNVEKNDHMNAENKLED